MTIRRPIGVTSASGRTGSEVVSALLERCAPVVALTRHPISGSCEWRRFDWNDPATHHDALAGLATLYVSTPARVDPAEVEAVLSTARSAGVERVVHLSAVGAEEMERLPHARIERAIEASAGASLVVRANWFFENFTHPPLSTWIERDGALVSCAGDAAVSIIGSHDVARALAAALLDDDRVGRLELTGPRAERLSDVAAWIGRTIHQRVRLVTLDPEQFVGKLIADGVPAPVVPILTQMFAQVGSASSARVTDAVEQLTGSPPAAVEYLCGTYTTAPATG